jgi:D-alanine-D-alanine ligase
MNKDELKRKRIAVLMGGISAEREVSLRTGQAALDALLAQGYQAYALDAGFSLAEHLRTTNAEVAFIALHGRFGEDGTVQGLLEMMRIPYTGSGVLASSLSIDKVATKKMLIYHDVPTPQFQVFCRDDEWRENLAGCDQFPLVVKPALEGSTIGISLVNNRDELIIGLEEAFKFDRVALVEEYIAGDEITVSVVNGEVLPIIKIAPKGGFYDYHAKYTAGQTEYILPAPFSDELTAKIQNHSMVAYDALGCEGAARVDFMVRGDEYYCLEVNTIPGMTATSLLPKAAAHVGIPFAELVEQILGSAALKVGVHN